MAGRPKNSEAEILEQDRVALENAGAQPQIASIMAEFGYNAKVIAEGKAILAETRKAYDANKTEDDETSEAYSLFKKKKDELDDTYTRHRKIGNAVFRKDAVTSEKLAISRAVPRTYMRWLETIKKFYTTAFSDNDIKTKLARLKLTPNDLKAGINLISELENARAEYLREKGESQDATQIKDAAFAKQDDWMDDFYAVAKIALEDHPQLLEVLGIVVRRK